VVEDSPKGNIGKNSNKKKQDKIQNIGALPSYTHGENVTHITNNTYKYNNENANYIGKRISTPSGQTITTPYDITKGNFHKFKNISTLSTSNVNIQSTTNLKSVVRLSSALSMSMVMNSSNSPNIDILDRNSEINKINGETAYSKVFKVIAYNIKKILSSNKKISNINSYIDILDNEFDSFDSTYTGYISIELFQEILDSVGIVISTSDFHVILSLFGRKENDTIEYKSFTNAVDSVNKVIVQSILPYSNEKISSRIRELRQEGRNIKDDFKYYDLDNTGLVTRRQFKEAILKLQLLETEHQLLKAMEDYASISDRSLVQYEDFINVIEYADKEYFYPSSNYNLKNRSLNSSRTLLNQSYNNRYSNSDNIHSSNYKKSLYSYDENDHINDVNNNNDVNYNTNNSLTWDRNFLPKKSDSIRINRKDKVKYFN
jgi:Ca2+-binding EF-hand superfamily protein